MDPRPSAFVARQPRQRLGSSQRTVPSLSRDLLTGLVAAGPPLYALGIGSGLANIAYHHLAGYRPTNYSPQNIRRGVSHVLEICDRWQRTLKQVLPDEDFAGKDILELGPGQSLGTGLVLLARGARSYTGVDVFPLAHKSPRALYEALAAEVCASPNLIERTRFEIVDFPELRPLHGPFDAVVSNSTLEHVEDVPGTFRALRRLVTGVMVHHIDARVHLRLRALDPLNHLRYEDHVYRRLYFKGIPNRYLADDYRQAALEAGFREVHVVPSSVASAEYLASVRPRLASRFRSRHDLEWLTFTLVAR
jgi:hypothetical protein